ncbi:hypothetical protein LTR37_000728 [Vermiconidia calcicola]|uniref:Uncharacterized protein n=1 Tax=Vermiconidia calcicola TaxID=1690605 RepID=A0ACC3NXV3_9PEZI|nr:hypothetical protein LTR37_000728 [Vermiconidia calcicola]
MDKVSEKRSDNLASPVTGSSTAWSDDSRDPENGPDPVKKLSFFERFWKSLHARRDCGSDAPEETYGTIIRRLDGCPKGYRQIATFQSSDPNFLLYRGFGYLHCRLLSALQYDIECLETELDKLDEWEKSKGNPEGRLTCKEHDDSYASKDRFPKVFQLRFKRTRPELLAELKTKLLEYDEVLLKTREVSTLQRPCNKDYRSVKSWFMNQEPVVQGEWKYIRREEDIITLRTGRECAGFDGYVEYLLDYMDACLKKCHCHVIRNVFMTKSLREKTKDPNLRYYAPARVDTLVGIIITTIIFILLVLPVVALYEISSVGERASAFEAIGILIIFTLVFGMAMSILTKAKRHELFAACAAYCAVLVVFIGDFTTQTVVIAQ